MFGNPVPGHILDKPQPWPGTPTFRLVNTFQDHLDAGRPPGIDLGNGREGDPVLAAATGIVAERFQDPNGALILRVQHPALTGRPMTGYAHLQSITVQKGELVLKGQQIGVVGSTGAPGQPHLHFGVRINNVEVDGWPMLDQNEVIMEPGVKPAGSPIGTFTFNGTTHAVVSTNVPRTYYAQTNGGTLDVLASLDLRERDGTPVDIDGNSPPKQGRDQVYLVDKAGWENAAFALRQDGMFTPTANDDSDWLAWLETHP